MLTKSPELQNICTQPLQYSSAARISFRTILENLDFSSEKQLLLPAYIGITDREGSGVLDPVLQTNTPYKFYALDKNLSAIKKNLYDLIKSKKFRALLVIHYFGFCQNDMEEISCLCKKYDVMIIEDCAHTMLSVTPYGQLGKLGDFSFNSIHKILATDDGGCLRVNNIEYEELLKKPQRRRPKAETYNMIALADLDAIREKRRFNYLQLMELIKDYPGIEIMYPDLPEGIAPHNFPIIVENGKREEMYFKLIERGIPVVALYYRMIEPIISGNYSDSLYVSENILNLPVHQDIDIDDLLCIKKGLQKYYG